MTVNLPLATLLPPVYRFLRKRTWASSAWDILPSMKTQGGFILDEVSRRSLPGFGHLTFHYNIGEIDAVYYGTQQGSATESDSVNLANQHIRLQMAPGSDDPDAVPAWRTVFVGVVEQQTTEIAPGGATMLGKRTYYAQDLLCSYLQKQRVDHSAAYAAGTFYGYTYGHPGFNGRDGDGILLGNLDPSLRDIGSETSGLPWAAGDSLTTDLTAFYQSILCHCMLGAGHTWTDLQALKNVLGISRLPFSPWFQVVGATDLLGTANAWECPTGTTAWEMINRICDRRRGKGMAFFDWSDDSGNPLAELTTYLRINAQTSGDVAWTKPSDGTPATPFNGATTNGTTTTVDLVGDHRNVASAFSVSDEAQHKYDYVETVGDPIQVLATLDYASNSLGKRWSADDETAFIAATSIARKTGRYNLVWQMHGFKDGWVLNGGDGATGASTNARLDYRCNDAGTIIVPPAGLPYDTAPNCITLLHDLPIHEGYNLAGSAPARYDGATETQAPVRRPPLLFIRQSLGTADRYYSGLDVFPIQMHVSQYGISIVFGDDLNIGVRRFSGNGSVGGAFSTAYIVITVGLELPHRIRMASGIRFGRKQLIRLRGYALHLAHPGAIWQLDATTAGKGVRAACGATATAPGILRDDRDRLAAQHALAEAWYLSARRSASWTLKACGLLPNFQVEDSDGAQSDVAYPTMGKVVTTLTAGGNAYALNTPITDIVYSAQGNGLTTWTTDWQDLHLQ